MKTKNVILFSSIALLSLTSFAEEQVYQAKTIKTKPPLVYRLHEKLKQHATILTSKMTQGLPLSKKPLRDRNKTELQAS